MSNKQPTTKEQAKKRVTDSKKRKVTKSTTRTNKDAVIKKLREEIQALNKQLQEAEVIITGYSISEDNMLKRLNNLPILTSKRKVIKTFKDTFGIK